MQLQRLGCSRSWEGSLACPFPPLIAAAHQHRTKLPVATSDSVKFIWHATQATLGRQSAFRATDFPALLDDGFALENAALLGSGVEVDWFNEWYPVAFIRDLDKGRPHRFVLLDIPLVLWWEAGAGAWRVLEDVCPHRLVPLSEGRITPSGQLECAYHGWAFSGRGRCERVPQQGKRDTPRACATAYPSAERQGLLFVLPKPLPPPLSPGGGGYDNADLAAALAEAAEAEARIPLVPELEEPGGGGWVAQDVWRDVPYDWSTLMENVLDPGHVPFTHHKSMSNRTIIGPYDLKLTSPLSKQGFTGMWRTGPRAGRLGPQSTVFVAPALMRHRLDSGAFSSLTVVYAVPMRPGKCRLVNRNVVRFNGTPLLGKLLKLLPAWLPHVSAHVLLEDDQVFLHLGEEELARRRAAGLSHAQVCYMPSTADTYVIAFNRWLQNFGGGGPFGGADAGFVEALGARLSRQQLLDRYSQHTEQCASCQQGLKQVAAARAATSAFTWAATLLAVFCATVAVAAATVQYAGGSAAAVAASPHPTMGNAGAAAVGSALVHVAVMVAGPYDPTGVVHMLRATAWAAVAAAAALAGARLDELRRRFWEGVYPPPRNLS